MPAFTLEDRLLVMQEQALWIAFNVLREEAVSLDHKWKDRIEKLAFDAKQIAQELRDYNDQFEQED